MTNANHLALHGDGIHITYYPAGTGPEIGDKGRARLFYQHGPVSVEFFDRDLIEDETRGLASLVTVTLTAVPDLGSTTFTLLVPDVSIPDGQRSAHVRTIGITKIHSETIAGPTRPDTYSVNHLNGTADVLLLPLETQSS